MQYPIKLLGIGLLAACWLAACKKQDVYREIDYNRISAIVKDNYNLSVFAAALDRTGMDETLQEEEGPFTALVPSDDAFARAGLADVAALKARSAAWVTSIVDYHIVPGRYELHKFPYLINQEVRTRNKGKLYVSRWVKGNNAVLTINGARVILQDMPASNGHLQIIDRVLEPYAHEVLADAVTADTITLFAEALRRSGLMEILRKEGPYTVFAPTNAAMQKAGYATIQQVKNTDPAVLRALCEFHICNDLRFINDYLLSIGASNTGSQRMINSFTATVTLLPDMQTPGEYRGITLRAPGNLTDIAVIRQDILAGNGVLHMVNDVLRLTR